jgi:Asp-tRNA(Asn)/Glu-tRNA(Gln) amidotransferase A subunit family amidase
MPTEYNSPIYRGHRPRKDADCVALLREAGAIILGKNVTTPFATVIPANTRNPHNPAHTPGGSSSGPAAAVADFMVPLALGTQTGGSTLRPAAFCGIFGFKPTFNRISAAGIKPLALSFDTIGLLARSADDVALLMSALDASMMTDRSPDAVLPLIGYCPTPFWSRAEESSRRALEDARKMLRDAGLTVADVELPSSFIDLAAANYDLIAAESAVFLGDEYRHHRAELPPALCAQIERGLATTPEQFHTARAAIVQCSIEMEHIFEDFDVLLTPSAPGEAPEGLASIGDAIFNGTWTSIHLPCLTIPTTRGPKNLPVGVQLVGRHGRDADLLSIARYISGILIKGN